MFRASLFFAAAVAAAAQTNSPIDFARDIKPALEANCIGCHASGSHAAFATRAEAFSGRLIVPGDPGKSAIYASIANGVMPPSGKMPAAQIELIRRWIAEGAAWPVRVVLTGAASKTVAASGAKDEIAYIRERIVANKANPPGTKTYRVTVPNTTVGYDMTAIPAGEFTMGSNGPKDEQPPHKVIVGAFWMQAHEVTWDEYRLFMFANQAGEVAHKDELVDGVSRPTRPYMEMSFGMGINGFPAISMTQHAANKYAEWLSAKTGEFYRLPTEAEWEYACRADSPAPAQLGDYAWFSGNSGGKYQKIATKKPNAWGLFDMLGNAMEWTLDAYAPYKPDAASNPEIDPYVRPTAPYPMAVRGGSWNDPAPAVTCSARVGSDPSWKQQDPQLPKSIWYETDAQWLGFRVIRPVKIPSAQEMSNYWNNGVEHDEQ